MLATKHHRGLLLQVRASEVSDLLYLRTVLPVHSRRPPTEVKNRTEIAAKPLRRISTEPGATQVMGNGTIAGSLPSSAAAFSSGGITASTPPGALRKQRQYVSSRGRLEVLDCQRSKHSLRVIRSHDHRSNSVMVVYPSSVQCLRHPAKSAFDCLLMYIHIHAHDFTSLSI